MQLHRAYDMHTASVWGNTWIPSPEKLLHGWRTGVLGFPTWEPSLVDMDSIMMTRCHNASMLLVV
jgi:hypothetical protein